jgi:ATP-dependent protease ClpP protease subunit
MRRLLKPYEVLNLHRGQKGWYSIRNHAGHNDAPAEIRLYGIIGWDVTAGDFLNELATITADAIDVHIATNGGDVNDGIAILNALRVHPATINTINDSQALSAGSFIMQAGDQRTMMPNSTMMIHDAMVGFAYAEGNAADLREFAAEVVKYADLLDKTSDNLASIYAERTGKGDQASWRRVMLDETWYSAQEAVAAGLADTVWTRAAENVHRPATPPIPPDPWDVDPAEYARLLREALSDA